MRESDAPVTVFLKDYQQPNYWVKRVKLVIDLDPDCTTIQSSMSFTRNGDSPNEITLFGKDLILRELSIDQEPMELSQIKFDPSRLILQDLPETFTLHLTTQIAPRKNNALEGLYLSHDKFYTQCEPEGFRRLTYYLDRPDVLAEFETTLIGPMTSLPVMLSNGNCVDQGKLPDGRHFVTWHDPFPKPSYLFALVAGDLSCVEDWFITKSGRKVAIKIFVEHENADKCAFALEATKRAMKWDEEVYGLEYDLDLYMIVAVSDFNMGAMENKGLNIFNAKYVLASPETATDVDFENILACVGHEYFHNWTGNRVTLRDWFQLCVKEGITVYRDQEFSGSQGSHSVKRIQDVKHLREHQFLEDNSPMAHPVRPQHYIEINNFYTSTVYKKGAEIIRMIVEVIGKEAYFRGMQLYFQRFDGSAVTVEDFLQVMQEASHHDLSGFHAWYNQAGTPKLKVKSSYDPLTRKLSLSVSQSLQTTGQEHGSFQPLVIPLRCALLGRIKPYIEASYNGLSKHEHLLIVRKTSEVFVFDEVDEQPILSCLRGFSAPVLVDIEQNQEECLHLLAYDSDPYNRYEAAQILAREWITGTANHTCKDDDLNEPYITTFSELLLNPKADPRLLALFLQVPTVDYLMNHDLGLSIDELYSARERFLKQLANRLFDSLLARYRQHGTYTPFAMDNKSIGERELKNCCLMLLAMSGREDARKLAFTQFKNSTNMTDSVAALTALASLPHPEREECLDHFYHQWKSNPLVIDKWFAIQASSHHPKVLEHVKMLLTHPDFDILNPNRVYSIFRQFTRAIPHGFHHDSGEGYAIIADYTLMIDKKNSQVAAMLAGFLSRHNKFDRHRQALMCKELERIRSNSDLSPDVFEVVNRSLLGE